MKTLFFYSLIFLFLTTSVVAMETDTIPNRAERRAMERSLLNAAKANDWDTVLTILGTPEVYGAFKDPVTGNTPLMFALTAPLPNDKKINTVEYLFIASNTSPKRIDHTNNSGQTAEDIVQALHIQELNELFCVPSESPTSAKNTASAAAQAFSKPPKGARRHSPYTAAMHQIFDGEKWICPTDSAMPYQSS